MSLRMMGLEPVEIAVSRASAPAWPDQLALADAAQMKV
jgi:hypothetical protein